MSARRAAIVSAFMEWVASLIVGSIPLLAHGLMAAVIVRTAAPNPVEFAPDVLFMAVATSGTSIMSVLLVTRSPTKHVGPSLVVLAAINVAMIVVAGVVYGAAASGATNGNVMPLSYGILIGSLFASLSAHVGLAAASLDWPQSQQL